METNFNEGGAARLRLKAVAARLGVSVRTEKAGWPRRSPMRAEVYNRFLENALPDGDLRYFSKSAARFRSVKAMAVLILHGLNFEVCGTSPALCLARRCFRSSVKPT